jgi:hypothetical protein
MIRIADYSQVGDLFLLSGVYTKGDGYAKIRYWNARAGAAGRLRQPADRQRADERADERAAAHICAG